MAVAITITVDDTDEKVLLNDLLDIQEWVQGAVDGKINNCWKRMQQNWTQQLMNDKLRLQTQLSTKDTAKDKKLLVIAIGGVLVLIIMVILVKLMR